MESILPLVRPIAVRVENLSYTYPGAQKPALSGVCFELCEGERAALLGANGSGKSTLLGCLNGLITPEQEAVSVMGLSPGKKEDLDALRRALGMVPQNPDDAIVGALVEEDAAFAPENLGLDAAAVRRKVQEALSLCGLWEQRERPALFLSGGEKQRLVLAGVLAMDSPILVLDEAVSMIDPAGRGHFLELLDRLQAAGKTILEVTHSLEDAFRCERCLVLHGGKLVFDGKALELIDKPEFESWGFVLPEALRFIRLIKKTWPDFSVGSLEAEETADRLIELMKGFKAGKRSGRPENRETEWGEAESACPAMQAGNGACPVMQAGNCACSAMQAGNGACPVMQPGNGACPVSRPDNCGAGGDGEERLPFRGKGTESVPPLLVFESVSYSYSPGRAVLEDLNFAAAGTLALIGVSGSGKSTALRHVNALLLPAEGRVLTAGMDTRDGRVKLAELRTAAAFSAQSPESALFEEFTADDVAFGPANAGLEGIRERTRRAMDEAGLPFGEFADRRTRSLSGGEKRLAALAGAAAMDSPILVLDEPLAGLDGFHQEKIRALIAGRKSRGKTVAAALHSMETAASFDLAAVLVEGRLAAFGPPREIFGPRWDPAWGLELPWAADVASKLAGAGVLPRGMVPLNAEELAECVIKGRAAEPRGMLFSKGIGLGFNTSTTAAEPQGIKPSPRIKGRMEGLDTRTADIRRIQPGAGNTEGAEKRGRARFRRRRKTGTEFFRSSPEFVDWGVHDRALRLRSAPGGVKLLFLLAGLAAALVLPPPVLPPALLAIILLAGAVSGIGPGRLLHGVRAAAPWLCVFIVIQQLYTGDGAGQALFSAGAVQVTLDNIIRSVLLLVRIASLMSLFALYAALTPVGQTLAALNAVLSLLKPLGFPSRDVSLAAGIALRFVPVISEEAERIVCAQLSRGGKKSRPVMILSMIAPLFLRALERSEKLVKAMTLRLYR